jgi:hypothetical protein
MDRLLQKGVDTNFQDDQINLSHVSALLHKNKVADLIIATGTDKNYEEHNPGGYHVFPADFYWLVQAGAEVVTSKFDCDALPALTTTSAVEYITAVAFPTVGSAPYYANTSITSAIRGVMYTMPTAIAAGFGNPNSRYVVVQNIMDTMYRKYTDVKVYWERYRDVYYPGSFLFVSTVSLGTVTVSSSAVNTNGTPVSTSYSFYNRTSITADHLAKFKPVKVVEGDLMYQAKQNAFYDTSIEEVTAWQSHDYIKLYRGESFIVTRLYYDYIRKPRTISLVLNQSCELAGTVHEKIIDMSVEILRVDTKQQNYEATVQDINLRT